MNQMTESGNAAQSTVDLDLRRTVCPLTLLRAVKSLESLPPGGELDVTVADTKSLVDIPKAARERGHVVVGATRVTGGFRIRIRRIAPTPPPPVPETPGALTRDSRP
jgi:TusA-related sulfurtransferase